jgi:hypothetical protein
LVHGRRDPVNRPGPAGVSWLSVDGTHRATHTAESGPRQAFEEAAMRIRTLFAATFVPVVASVTAGVILATSSPATATTAVAPGTWSTQPQVLDRRPFPTPQVTGIRVGHHRGFDRVVLDLSGKAPGFRVRYVTTLRHDGSGTPVDLLGPVSLRVVLDPADAHNPNTGRNTLRTPARTKWRLDQIRETALIGDFEAVVTLGVGLDHRAPFRVMTLSNPTRIVVDIKH